MKPKLNLNFLLALLLLVVVVLGCGRMRKSASNPVNQGSSRASEPAAPGEITAEDLFAEYQQDKDAADNKYKGKVIVVRGTIDTTKVDGTNPYITMKTASMILRVQCIFSKTDAAVVSGLTKDSTVKVRGRVFGRIGNVVLQDCEVL